MEKTLRPLPNDGWQESGGQGQPPKLIYVSVPIPQL